jgi:hypothetical protein
MRLAILIAMLGLTASAQDSFQNFSPPCNQQEFVASGYGYIECVIEGDAAGFFWQPMYAAADAYSWNCSFPVYLQAWGWGSPQSLYAGSKAGGGPPPIPTYETWVYPDGGYIAFGPHPVTPC